MSRTLLVSTLAAAALVTGAGGVAVAATAHTAAKPTTLTFTAQHSGEIVTGKSTYDLADTDVKAGKKIGLDVLSCADRGGVSNCQVAFAYKGGQIYAAFTLSSTGALSGRITGGTAAFAHVTGTITGQAVSRSNVSVKLVYTT